MTQTTRIGINPVQPMERSPTFQDGLKGLLRPVWRFILYTTVILGGAGLLWEGYKALGGLTNGNIPFTTISLPIPTSDAAFPHLATIFKALFSPTTNGPLLINYFLIELTVTLREAALGLVIATVLGCVIAVFIREFKFLERGILPWLVISQTIPLVALAPLIIVWAGMAGLPSWIAVSFIAVYLSFFPIVINMLTGLNSPEPIQVELMRSVSASYGQVLWWLRLPAALPYLFTGLRLAAIASVIAAVVGEITAGTGMGIGRAILSSAYYFTNAPENLFGAVIVASLGGIIFVQIIAVLETLTLRKRTTV